MRQDGLAPRGAAGPLEALPRKRAAAARMAMPNEAERLLLLCADWLWESDEHHRLSWLSADFADHAGLSASSVLGRTRLTALRSTGESDGSTVDDILQHRAFRGFLHDFRDRDGARKTICLSGLPRFDAGGIFLGYRGTGRVMQDSQSVHAARPAGMDAAVQVGVPLFAKDADNRFLFANPAFADIFASRPDAIVGRRAFEIMSPRQALRLENAENAVLLTGMPCAIVLTFRDGPARIVHLARMERQAGRFAIAGHMETVMPVAAGDNRLDIDPQAGRVLVVHHDETHRQNLAGQMAQARFDACAAGNAAEALGVLRATAALGHPADCILLDEQMPRDDFQEIIRLSTKVTSTPVILLAANDRSERVLATVRSTIRRHKLAKRQVDSI